MAVRHVHRALAHEAPRGRVCDLRAHPGRIYRSVPDGGGVAARGLQLRLPGSRVPTDRYVALRFGRVWAEGMERGPTATCGRGCRTDPGETRNGGGDWKSTRLNSSHVRISYAVFCLKQKNL